ncbi:MAG: hypothetical protein ACRD44_05940 [Bryobacteraceae bacterium]
MIVLLLLMAQSFTHRGYLETRVFAFPQAAPNDAGRFIGESLLRWEPEVSLGAGWRLHGSFDARADTHRQFEREFRLDWQDRRLRRPAFSLRRFSAQYHRGGFTAEFGRQLIRWGKADILNPTDRFAPRDYLNVVDSDVLGVTAARLSYKSVEVVWTPRFTPSRTPLLDQRWTVLPEGLVVPPIGSRFPGRSQFGARWNRAGRRFEHSLVFFDGFHHLPLLDIVQLARVYPRLRLYGGDAVVPLPWFTLKGEAAWFTSATARADEYALYVIQLERTHGEWVFIGGYAGEAVTERRNPFGFAPDRGFARAFLGRAGYTIDARRSVAFEAALRQNGDGVWVKSEYSHLLGRSFRATAGFTLIRGSPADFLGQYRRNSHLLLALRYSF